MPHITLLAYEQCATAAIHWFIDALSIANLWHKQLEESPDEIEPLFRWDIISMDGKPVQGEGRITIVPHGSIHDKIATDFILIPAFLPPLDFIGKVPKELTDWIWRQHKNNILIGSTCTGTFLLAETGILDGRTATTNINFSKYFQKRYPSVNLKPERIITEDNGLLCSGATSSFQDLCVYLIEKFGFAELAAVVSKMLLMEPKRSQSPYVIFDYQKQHRDLIVKKAQCYMEENFAGPVPIDSLAKDLGVSPRHFIRRFKNATGDSPLAYLQRIRIEAAKQKMERTTLSLEEITCQVGYEDPNSFRKLFRKITGLPPREYRNRFTRML